MPILDRQQLPGAAATRARVPSRVAETRPTPLQGVFIYLSVVVLACGVVAISALELGVHPREPVVKLPVLVGVVILAALAADAVVRIWRSALAWLPVDRGRALFRFVWVATVVAAMAAVGLGAWLVLSA